MTFKRNAFAANQGADSAMIRFQSFAFPLSADGQEARLALIDTCDGKSTSPRLQMEG